MRDESHDTRHKNGQDPRSSPARSIQCHAIICSQRIISLLDRAQRNIGIFVTFLTRLMIGWLLSAYQPQASAPGRRNSRNSLSPRTLGRPGRPSGLPSGWPTPRRHASRRLCVPCRAGENGPAARLRADFGQRAAIARRGSPGWAGATCRRVRSESVGHVSRHNPAIPSLRWSRQPQSDRRQRCTSRTRSTSSLRLALSRQRRVGEWMLGAGCLVSCELLQAHQVRRGIRRDARRPPGLADLTRTPNCPREPSPDPRALPGALSESPPQWLVGRSYSISPAGSALQQRAIRSPVVSRRPRSWLEPEGRNSEYRGEHWWDSGRARGLPGLLGERAIGLERALGLDRAPPPGRRRTRRVWV